MPGHDSAANDRHGLLESPAPICEPHAEPNDSIKEHDRDPNHCKRASTAGPAVCNKAHDDFRSCPCFPVPKAADRAHVSVLQHRRNVKMAIRADEAVVHVPELVPHLSYRLIKDLTVTRNLPPLQRVPENHAVTANREVSLEVVDDSVGIANPNMAYGGTDP